MEHSAWTDERLDDMAAGINNHFELLRAEMVQTRIDLRAEMAQMRTDLRAEMAQMRTDLRAEMAEMRTDMRELRTELHDSRRDMFHGAIALFGSQVAIFAVLLAQTL